MTLAPLESFVSPLVGLVPDVYELTRDPGDSAFVRYACRPPTSARLLGQSLEHLDASSGGADLDRGSSRAAAIGEILERYSASFQPDGTVVATAAELGERVPDPSSFALFADEQYRTAGFPYAPFTRDTLVRWLPAVELPDRRPALLPAQLVLLAPQRAPGEPPIDRSTSSGLACAPSFAEAALRGLYEVLERDAFMLTWTNRLELPLLDWEAEPALARLGGRMFASLRATVLTIDASAIWQLPTIVAVVRGRPGDGAAVAVGAAARARVAETWAKAVSEACCVRMWLLHLRRHEPWLEPMDAGDVHDFEDHVRFHGSETVAARTAFLWRSDRRVRLAVIPELEAAEPGEELAALCRRVAVAGYRVFAADVTSPDVAEGGLRVVRVVVPGLVSLDLEHGARHLGGPRILEATAGLGLRERPLRRSELNPDPHPFP